MIDAGISRAMWQALEPLHAVIYFAPESKTEYEAVGLKGYWMGYFASRSAPMGAVPADVVIATFYNFHPERVRRAIPDAWSLSTPEAVLAARNAVALAAVGRAWRGSGDAIREAGHLAETAARAASPEGRALFAGHAALPWPDDPLLRLWHAATLLREHRGDGHVATLVAEGVDGFEAHVLAAGAGLVDPAFQRTARGISEDEWAAAEERMRARGLLAADAALTEMGRALKDHIERRTDELSAAPYAAIGSDGCERLAALVNEATRDDQTLPFPNPIGLTRA